LNVVDRNGLCEVTLISKDTLWFGEDSFLFDEERYASKLSFNYHGSLVDVKKIDGVTDSTIICHFDNGSYLSTKTEGQVSNYSFSMQSDIGSYDKSPAISLVSAEGASSNFVHLLQGTGSVTLGTTTIEMNNELLIVCFDDSGNLAWSKKGNFYNEGKNQISIDENNGYVYNTYSTGVLGESLIEKIALSTGTIVDTYTLYSEGEYNIESICATENRLFFGGELSSEIGVLSLGEMDFLNLNGEDVKKAYVSYIVL